MPILLQVSLEFSGNQADIGPVLFVTSLDACSWFSYSDGYFNTNITETWDFMTARYFIQFYSKVHNQFLINLFEAPAHKY